MKGLILKDLYQSWRYYKSSLVLMVVFLVSSVGNENLFFLFYPAIIAGMIPPGLLAYDERSKWDVYCGALPVTKAQVVSAKYLLGAMAQVFVLLSTALFHTVVMCFNGSFSGTYLASVLAMLATLSGISASITLPFMFKLGVEKGRMAYYVMIGIVCAGSVGASSLFQENPSAQLPTGAPLYLTALAAVGIYALSWWLSVRFYEKREVS